MSGKENNFSVLHFVFDNTVEVVPTNWIQGTKCRFPKNKPRGLSELQEDTLSFPESSWPEWGIVFQSSVS